MPYVGALSWVSSSQNTVHAARNRLANLKAIFHIKSDSAMFDNIAVLSGNLSADRVLAACGIGPLSSGWHTTKTGQEICQAIVVIETRRFFSRSKRPVNLSDASFERAAPPDPAILSNPRNGGQSTNPPYQQICNEYMIDSRISFIFTA